MPRSIFLMSLPALVIMASSSLADSCSSITKERQRMIDQWQQCIDEAVDRFAIQSESATVVADAALTTCENYEIYLMNNYCADMGYNSRFSTTLRNGNFRPQAIARVMAWRAAHSATGRGSSRPDTPRPAIEQNRM